MLVLFIPDKNFISYELNHIKLNAKNFHLSESIQDNGAFTRHLAGGHAEWDQKDFNMRL